MRAAALRAVLCGGLQVVYGSNGVVAVVAVVAIVVIVTVVVVAVVVVIAIAAADDDAAVMVAVRSPYACDTGGEEPGQLVALSCAFLAIPKPALDLMRKNHPKVRITT